MIRQAILSCALFFLVLAPLTAQDDRQSALEKAALGRVGTAVELDNVPGWLKGHQFKQTKFTFVRIKYDTAGGTPRSRAMNWATDFPDADLNLAATFGSLTKLDVSEPSRVLRLNDPQLRQYPFIYLTEPGRMHLQDAELQPLRDYLNGGGFLMIDDFWGEAEWENLRLELKRVFPGREPQELPLSHPVFHCVFDLKEKPQVVSIHAFFAGFKTERPDAREAHYRGISNDQGRLLVLICHNTDLADGWERVSEDERYSREMSRAKAVPMGINAIFHALTH
jgi:hypothetical protein